MTYQEYCDLIRRNYRRLHPDLYTFRDDIFVPSLVQAVHTDTLESLLKLPRQVHPQVYVFDMLRPEFCAKLLEEAAAFETWSTRFGLAPLRPNTMNNYGTVLDSIGFA